MNWLKSLNPRTKEYIPESSSPFDKAMGVVVPIMIYRTIDILIFYSLAAIIKKVITKPGAFADFCINNSSFVTSITKCIALLIAILAVLPFFRKEKPVFIYKGDKKHRYIYCLCLGISASIFFNFLFYIAGITESNSTYNEIVTRQNATGLLCGLIVYGIVAPIAEEIVFRGILYNRIRRDFGLIMALIFTPLVFGVFHGNLVQAAYGAILGFIICWSYEKYGAFIYPLIMHASANAVIFVAMKVDEIRRVVMNPVAFVIFGLVMVIAAGLMLKEE